MVRRDRSVVAIVLVAERDTVEALAIAARVVSMLFEHWCVPPAERAPGGEFDRDVSSRHLPSHHLLLR